MQKEKQIQIPEALYTQMCAFVLMEDFRTEQNYKTIEKGIYDKIDRQIEHDLYTKYKSAPTKEQKEQARKEYLNRKGIKPSFRW
jgi:hypothetical protein